MSKYLTNEILTGCSWTQKGTSEFGNFRTETLAAFLTLAHLSNNEPWHTLDILYDYGSRANLTFCDEPPVESSQRTPDGAQATVVSHITCCKLLVTHLHQRCRPANTKPMARPPPLPSNCPDSTRRKRFMHRLRWQPWSSLVRPDRPRYDHLPQEGLIQVSIKVITVLARRKSKSTGNTVLFVGASDAGKTAILSSVSRQLPLPHTFGDG